MDTSVLGYHGAQYTKISQKLSFDIDFNYIGNEMDYEFTSTWPRGTTWLFDFKNGYPLERYYYYPTATELAQSGKPWEDLTTNLDYLVSYQTYYEIPNDFQLCVLQISGLTGDFTDYGNATLGQAVDSVAVEVYANTYFANELVNINGEKKCGIYIVLKHYLTSGVVFSETIFTEEVTTTLPGHGAATFLDYSKLIATPRAIEVSLEFTGSKYVVTYNNFVDDITTYEYTPEVFSSYGTIAKAIAFRPYQQITYNEHMHLFTDFNTNDFWYAYLCYEAYGYPTNPLPSGWPTPTYSQSIFNDYNELIEHYGELTFNTSYEPLKIKTNYNSDAILNTSTVEYTFNWTDSMSLYYLHLEGGPYPDVSYDPSSYYPEYVSTAGNLLSLVTEDTYIGMYTHDPMFQDGKPTLAPVTMMNNVHSIVYDKELIVTQPT